MSNIKKILNEYTGRFTAQVLWICKRDRNGILKTVEGHEVYFDESVCNCDFDDIKPKMFLEFNFNQNITDCLCARDLVIDE
jgi:hypothetical protein